MLDLLLLVLLGDRSPVPRVEAMRVLIPVPACVEVVVVVV
jgi:hypothetical protein